MKEHEIWIQAHTDHDGNQKPAVLFTTVEGEDFDDALLRLVDQDPIFARHYDRRNHTFWGVPLAASEDKANGLT